MKDARIGSVPSLPEPFCRIGLQKMSDHVVYCGRPVGVSVQSCGSASNFGCDERRSPCCGL